MVLSDWSWAGGANRRRFDINTPTLSLLFVMSSACAEGLEDVYAGVGIASVDYATSYQGVAFEDSPAALHLYGGYRLSDAWSVEAAYKKAADAESGEVRGSGTSRFSVSDSVESVLIQGLRVVKLSEAFQWKRSFELFGSMGYFKSRAHRTAVDVVSGTTATLDSKAAGITAGFGAIHERRKISLRGYVQWFDLFDSELTRDIGVATEFRFK